MTVGAAVAFAAAGVPLPTGSALALVAATAALAVALTMGVADGTEEFVVAVSAELAGASLPLGAER